MTVEHKTRANTQVLERPSQENGTMSVLFRVSVDMVQGQGAERLRGYAHRTPVLRPQLEQLERERGDRKYIKCLS